MTSSGGQTGTAAVSCVADTVGISIPVLGGSVSFTPETAGRAVRIESSATGGVLSLSPALFGLITASSAISANSTSTLTVASPVSTTVPILSLSAGSNLVVNDSVSNTGSILLSSAQEVQVVATPTRSAAVSASGSLAVVANDILLRGSDSGARSARMSGASVTLVGRALTLQGGAVAGSFADIVGTTAVSAILNQPMVVSAGPTASSYARMDSPAGSINLLFPLLSSGGYYVNGVQGGIWDPVTASGFRVGGLPGVLGAGFDVIYGLGAAFSAFAAVSGGTTSVSAPLFAAVDQSGQLPPIVLASIGVTRGLLSGALQDDDPRTASQCN